jgi:hypothetical protein
VKDSESTYGPATAQGRLSVFRKRNADRVGNGLAYIEKGQEWDGKFPADKAY